MNKAILPALIIVFLLPILACSISGIYYPPTVTPFPQKIPTETVTATPIPSSTPTSVPTTTASSTSTPLPDYTATPTPSGFLLNLQLHDGHEITWSPDGNILVVLTKAGVFFLDALDFSMLSETNLDWVPSYGNFSLDGSYFAACERPRFSTEYDAPSYFGLWDGNDGSLEQEELVDIPTCPAQFISTNRLFFYEPRDHKDPNKKLVHIWELGKGLITQLEFNASIFSHRLLGFGPYGNRLLFLVHEIDLGQLTDAWEIWLLRPGITSTAASAIFPTTPNGEAYITPDNKYLVLSNGDCEFNFRNMGNYEHAFTVSWCASEWYEDDKVEKTIFHKNGRWMAVIFDHHRVVIWNLLTGREKINHDFTGAFVFDLAFNPVSTEYAILSRGPVQDYSKPFKITKWELLTE
jgi:WD40 repeat protein